MSQEEFMNSPLKFGGVLSPAFDIAGVMIQEIKDENNEYLTEALQQDLEEAKAKGVNAVREFVSIPNVNQLIEYRIEEVYKETATKMLRNEFLTFKEMTKYDNSEAKQDRTVFLLIKRIPKEINIINILETIFYETN